MSQEPASPQETALQTVLEPHRGKKILALGIISIVSLPLLFFLSGFLFIKIANMVTSEFVFSIFLWTPGLFAFICGIMARIMGTRDLERMDNGIMDPSGRSDTLTGKILGSIVVLPGIAFLVIYGLFRIFWIILGPSSFS
jgi:hypothetical protein